MISPRQSAVYARASVGSPRSVFDSSARQIFRHEAGSEAAGGRLWRLSMDTIVLLITLSAGVLAVHYKERLRTFVPGRPGSPRSLVDQSLGLARLELPDGWRQAEDLNDNASIEAINSLHGRHVIVISDAIEDFVPEMTVYEHSVNTRAELTANIQLISCSGPERRMIGGYDALQYRDRGLLSADTDQISSHHDRRPPRIPSSARLGHVLALRPCSIRSPARRFQRAAGAARCSEDEGTVLDSCPANSHHSRLALRSPLRLGARLAR